MATKRPSISDVFFSRQNIGRMVMTGAVAGAYCFLNGPFLPYMKEYKLYGIRKYYFSELKAGLIREDLEMTEPLASLVHDTLKDVAMLPERKENLKICLWDNTKTKTLGSPNFSNTFVCLPEFLNVVSGKELRSDRLNNLLLRTYKWKVPEAKQWMSGPGVLLIDSFVMSEKAKRFLITKELYTVDNDYVTRNSIYIVLFLYMFYVFADMLLNRSKVPVQHQSVVRLFLVSGLCGMVSLSGFLTLQMLSTMQNDKNGLAKALTLGQHEFYALTAAIKAGKPIPIDKEMYVGCIEYYSKVIQRNQAMKVLMKQTASWYDMSHGQFTDEGNHKSSMVSYEAKATDSLDLARNWYFGKT